MSGRVPISQWVRYTWDLSRPSRETFDIGMPSEFTVRAGTPAEAETIHRVVIKAYASDPIWLPTLAAIEQRMRARIDETISSSSSIYLLVEYRGSVVAVSGIAESHATDQNLLTRICVLPDYQRRGVGRALLLESLLWLRERGLRTAQVYTRQGSLADRKMYPLFGSRRTTDVIYPGVQ